MTDIVIGQLRFAGGIGDRGFVIHELEGLSGGIGVRSNTASRPAAHGEFDSPSFLDARVVSWSGFCLASSPEELEQYGNLLAGIGAAGASFPVMFDRPAGVVTGTARLLDETPELVPVVWGSIAKYNVHIRMPDPRMYGRANRFSGTEVPVFQYGNFPASPVITATHPTGAPNGYTVFGPDGKQFKVSLPLRAGHPHSIDFATGFLYEDGARVLGGLWQSQTWTIPPGLRVGMWSSQDVQLDIDVFDTFI